MSSSTERDTLPKQQVSSEGLGLRQETYERYGVPRVNYRAWVLERIAWRGNERVLDVGSGPGQYYRVIEKILPGVHYFGMDVSSRMLEAHPARSVLAQGDAQRLPFPDSTFDVIMANHMLFHVPDRGAAIEEFRRVLKPTGLLVTATNSMHTMPELQALMRRALVLLGVSGKAQAQAPPFPHHSFALENAAPQLARHFYAVVRFDLPIALVFPSVEPVMAFLESTRELREPYLPESVAWDDLMLVMREQIAALLNHFGELVINKLSGVLVASERGGFIEDFVVRQDGRKGR